MNVWEVTQWEFRAAELVLRECWQVGVVSVIRMINTSSHLNLTWVIS